MTALRDKQRLKWWYPALLTALSFAIYWPAFFYDSFQPETALYYFYSDGRNFLQALQSYGYLSLMWYRPTPSMFYWIGQQFLGWHDLLGWKLFHFVTVLAAAYAIYWLVARCFSGGRLAGILAATCFLAHPNVYPGIMEVAGFDFLHIVLTILCVGLYFQAATASVARSLWLTALSWLCCVIALTSKEMALALPPYLLVMSVLLVVLDPNRRVSMRRELLRLLPFFLLLPVYYFMHLAKLPPTAFPSTGYYRSSANWTVILANCRKFLLWIPRIYAFTGETAGERMYQSTVLNNVVGIGSALLVAGTWLNQVRENRHYRLVGALMIGWIAVFLVLPIYSGGFLWHVNLPVVGYCVLFGLAAARWFESVPSPLWRSAALAAFFIGSVALSRVNLHTELYSGTHATAFRINHSVLRKPPVEPERLGKSPLIYIEDRLGIGGWWYGNYGILFNYVYLRHDLHEVVVPRLPLISQELRNGWLAHPNAYFFRYDEQYDWHDASAEFRAAIQNTAAPR